MPPKNNIHKQKPSAVQCSEDCDRCETTQAVMRWSGPESIHTSKWHCQLHIYANSQHLQSRSGKVKMLVLQLYEVQDFHKCWVKKKNLYIIYIFPLFGVKVIVTLNKQQCKYSILMQYRASLYCIHYNHLIHKYISQYFLII